MPTSYNGWPASSDPDAIGVDRGFTAAGVTFPGGVKDGDVAVIFRALVEFLDREVEPVRAGWCWGYNYRATTGGSSLSNHASATAIDYNAPLHPYNVRGTWTDEQIRKVDAFLRDVLDGVMRWGEHYSSNVDGMHFEINTSDRNRVAAVAARLRNEDDMTPQQADQLANTAAAVERIERKQDRLIAGHKKVRERLTSLREKIEGGRADVRQVASELGDLVKLLEADE